ncbi:MAG: CvpA family protein [Anaerolineae bacterium]|nr:CvpA family protein [Anaerolineae bacterium]
MIQLSTFFWLMIGLFAIVGFMRGWTKELIATAGVVLALFTLKQLETLIVDPLTDGRQTSKFYLQATILITLAFFAYQTPPEALSRSSSRRTSNREGLQEGILGALVGAANGYLVIGSLWWYMDNLEYPLSPYVLPAAPGSASAGLVDMLPLSWMLGGDGGLLSLLMIGLFIFVIVAIV